MPPEGRVRIRPLRRLPLLVSFVVGALPTAVDGFIRPSGPRSTREICTVAAAGARVAEHWRCQNRKSWEMWASSGDPEVEDVDELSGADLVRLLEEEDDRARAEETELWWKALVLYAQGQPSDPVLGRIDGLQWLDVCARAQARYVDDLVELEDDRARVRAKLDMLLVNMKEYFRLHSLFTDALTPVANGCDELFVERGRFRAFRDSQLALSYIKDRYLDAYVDFWSDLAAVVKSQQDIPGRDGRRNASPLDGLPAPWGFAAKATPVVLPMPSLFEWARDDYEGVEEQIGAVMIFKAVTLPALQTFRKQATFENLVNYAGSLGQLWRKCGRWFGKDPQSLDFLDKVWAETEGQLGEEDPLATGHLLESLGQKGVSRRGPEDNWLVAQ